MKLRKPHPWQSALLATSGLAAMIFASLELWQQGLQHWAFLLAFAAVWSIIAISWSNVDFTERSGTMLARIVDHNFEQMHERIEELEKEVERLRADAPDGWRKAS